MMTMDPEIQKQLNKVKTKSQIAELAGKWDVKVNKNLSFKQMKTQLTNALKEYTVKKIEILLEEYPEKIEGKQVYIGSDGYLYDENGKIVAA